MKSAFKPFFLGIVFTSLTWAFVLYFFFSFNLEGSHVKKLIKNNNNKLGNRNISSESQESQYSHKKISLVSQKKESGKLNGNDLGLVRNNQDKIIREDGYHNHAFNVLVSTRLDYHRKVPDTRHKLCSSKQYQDLTLNTSVIICFYNEEIHTLYRTVYSVLDRTPPHLLHEILLINDNSDGDLHSEVQKYIAKNFPSSVKLHKTKKREGLIRARIFGAKQATGQVLLFLDSHCEVNQDWLQPLLHRIQQNRTFVVTPIIDIINSDTFQYTSSPLVRGGFNWGLHFKWDSLPDDSLKTSEDFVAPILSPTMAGGLFAIDREYFYDIGEYDAGMNVWGGENLEISFRIWMCGGRLEIIPCSRVGHIFRRRRPYGSPNGEDTMTYNSLRAAHVWLDGYIENFFQIRPDARNTPYGEIGPRKRLRELMKCQSFEWYLKNVYPELQLPEKKDSVAANSSPHKPLKNKLFKKNRKRNYLGTYQIQVSGSDKCVQCEKEVTSKGSNLVLAKCSHTKKQQWSVTDKGELVLAELLCMESPENSNHRPRLSKCHEMGGLQEWKHHDDIDTPLYNMAAGLCLGFKEASTSVLNIPIIMTMCSETTASQWDFIKL